VEPNLGWGDGKNKVFRQPTDGTCRLTRRHGQWCARLRIGHLPA
jgi:hypothetical protein